MKEKLGILTFHRAQNYGAVLQAYALSECINQMGKYDAEVIDYKSKDIEDTYKPFHVVGDKTIKNIIIMLLTANASRIKKIKFDQFRNKYLKMSEKSYTRNEIADISNQYSTFITGSDQVFNDVCAGFDPTYFLDFVNDSSKKNSYAASFGFSKIPDDKVDIYKQRLQDFNRLSVRENAAKEIVRELLNRNAEVHIDPTFLLNQKEWEKLAVKPKEEKYILIYLLQPTETIFEHVRKLSKITGCKPILMHLHFFKNNGIKQVTTASPEEYLGYFKYADYIVTNSFHGTAFSIIFHKKFMTEYQTTAAARNSRQENLLKTFGLLDRVVSKEHEIDEILQEIDYENVEQLIEKERKNAIEFIKKI